MSSTPSPVVRIDAAKIHDWATFFDVFQDAFGFPAFFGRNMDAWIDCLSYLEDPGAGMTKVHVRDGGVLTLVVAHVSEFRSRCPEQYAALIECAAFVNWRLIEGGGRAVLAMAFND